MLDGKEVAQLIVFCVVLALAAFLVLFFIYTISQKDKQFKSLLFTEKSPKIEQFTDISDPEVSPSMQSNPLVQHYVHNCVDEDHVCDLTDTKILQDSCSTRFVSCRKISSEDIYKLYITLVKHIEDGMQGCIPGFKCIIFGENAADYLQENSYERSNTGGLAAQVNGANAMIRKHLSMYAKQPIPPCFIGAFITMAVPDRHVQSFLRLCKVCEEDQELPKSNASQLLQNQVYCSTKLGVIDNHFDGLFPRVFLSKVINICYMLFSNIVDKGIDSREVKLLVEQMFLCLTYLPDMKCVDFLANNGIPFTCAYNSKFDCDDPSGDPVKMYPLGVGMNNAISYTRERKFSTEILHLGLTNIAVGKMGSWIYIDTAVLLMQEGVLKMFELDRTSASADAQNDISRKMRLCNAVFSDGGFVRYLDSDLLPYWDCALSKLRVAEDMLGLDITNTKIVRNDNLTVTSAVVHCATESLDASESAPLFGV